jgi:hypothetical protein
MEAGAPVHLICGLSSKEHQQLKIQSQCASGICRESKMFLEQVLEVAPWRSQGIHRRLCTRSRAEVDVKGCKVFWDVRDTLFMGDITPTSFAPETMTLKEPSLELGCPPKLFSYRNNRNWNRN